MGFRVEFYIKIGIVLLGATLPFTLIIWPGPVAILQASIVSIVTSAAPGDYVTPVFSLATLRIRTHQNEEILVEFLWTIGTSMTPAGRLWPEGRPPRHEMVSLRIMRALKGLIARCKRAVSIGAHLASLGSGIWANLFGVGESITPGVCAPQKGSLERGW